MKLPAQQPRGRRPPPTPLLIVLAVWLSLGSGCESDSVVDAGVQHAGDTEPLVGAPFVARRLVAIGSADALLLGTTGTISSEDCDDVDLAAAWLGDKGEVERAIRIPYEDCARSVDEAQRSRSGKITLSSWIHHPSSGYEDSASQSPVLVRLRPDGSLDSAFAGGIVRSSASAFALRSDGSLVAADGGHYLNNGQIDLRFAAGRQIARVFDSTFAGGIATWPNDAFAVISLVRETAEDVVLQRFDSDGTVDRAFGDRGIARSDLDPRYGDSYDTRVGPLLRMPDGGLLTLASYVPPQVVYGRFALLKFRADGRLDPRFGRGGRVTISPSFAPGRRLDVRHLTLQRDGRPVVVAQAGPRKQLVLRFRTDGRPDRSFGKGGRVELSLGRGVATNVVQLGNGSLLGAVGLESGASTVFRLGRDGALDRRFGESGSVRVKP